MRLAQTSFWRNCLRNGLSGFGFNMVEEIIVDTDETHARSEEHCLVYTDNVRAGTSEHSC
jgi:hypothetical protein